MIILSQTTDKLQVKLNDTATKQMDCFVTWRDNRLEPVVILNVFTPNRTIATTNDTTKVTLVEGPAENLKRTVDFISIHNKNGSAHKVTILFDDGTVNVILWKGEIAADERLQYTDTNGFTVFTAIGAIKYAV